MICRHVEDSTASHQTTATYEALESLADSENFLLAPCPPQSLFRKQHYTIKGVRWRVLGLIDVLTGGGENPLR